MKRLFPVLLVFVIAITACSKSTKPLYEKGSEEYNFFRTLADSVGIDVYNPDKVTVLVSTNSFDITTNDLMPQLYTALAPQKDDWKRLPAERIKMFTKQAAEEMTVSKLLYAKAVAEGFGVADSVVTNELEKIYAARGGKEQFIEFLNQQGLTLEFVEEDIRTQHANGAYMDSVVFKTSAVTDEMLKEVYDQGETASVRHILFDAQNKSEAEKAEIKTKAEEVLARAKNGEAFDALADEFTDDPGSKGKGGLYENFPHGQMVPPFDKASFTLPIGSISDLVETQFGWHIIKVEGRTPYAKSFDEVKEQLRPALERSAKMEAYTALVEQLKNENNFVTHFEALN